MINLYYARRSDFLKVASSSFVDKKDTIGETPETIVLLYRGEKRGREKNENPGRIPVAAILINETV